MFSLLPGASLRLRCQMIRNVISMCVPVITVKFIHFMGTLSDSERQAIQFLDFILVRWNSSTITRDHPYPFIPSALNKLYVLRIGTYLGY